MQAKTKNDEKRGLTLWKRVKPDRIQKDRWSPLSGRLVNRMTLYHQRDGDTTLFGKSIEATETIIDETPDGGIGIKELEGDPVR